MTEHSQADSTKWNDSCLSSSANASPIHKESLQIDDALVEITHLETIHIINAP